jgi:hypothetical protein
MATEYVLSEKQYQALIGGIRASIDAHRQRASHLETMLDQVVVGDIERRGDPDALCFDSFVAFVSDAYPSLALSLRGAEVETFRAGRMKLKASGQQTSYLALHKGVLKDLLERFAGVEFKKIILEKD